MHKPTLTLLLAAATIPAWSAGRATPDPDKLLACAAIEDSSARLACFDREVAPLAASRQEHTPAARQPDPATPPESKPQFGEEQLSAEQRQPVPQEAQVLHAHIAELKSAGSGRYLVVLDNGQVWRHEDAYLGTLLKEGDAITISKAALGSYRLTRDAGQAKNWMRVTRMH